MLLRTLDYEEQFHCLAGRCPHSCCIGWEVVLDEDHARRYLTGDDPLSRRAAEATAVGCCNITLADLASPELEIGRAHV